MHASSRSMHREACEAHRLALSVRGLKICVVTLLYERDWISPPPPPSNLSSPSEGWAATEFAPVENSSAKSISTYNWDEGEGKDGFPELSNRVQGISKSQSGWEDTEWEPLGDANGASNRLEEARKKREEKKLLRQKELEARRATRITGGPMKLGAKKV
uniref:Uncharacterized protein n=1 Tax=Timema shepardi TaxID=629360 RepID=A0A7R9B947_TIMSH|nr:unnamed protein product [Timema shepardi]